MMSTKVQNKATLFPVKISGEDYNFVPQTGIIKFPGRSFPRYLKILVLLKDRAAGSSE